MEKKRFFKVADLLLENFQSFFVANFEFEWEVCEKFRRLADASH